MKKELFDQPWMSWAVEIQGIAQCGLAYVKDPFDRERYQRLRDISAEMLALGAGIETAKAKEIFCCEKGYQTPKLVTRAAVFRDGKILLVKESNGLWSLPGGWTDVTETIGSNTVKETFEEAGLRVEPERLVALIDRDRYKKPSFPFGITEAFVLCRLIGGSFRRNVETSAADFFSLEALPPLDPARCAIEELELCFRAAADEGWQPVFD